MSWLRNIGALLRAHPLFSLAGAVVVVGGIIAVHHFTAQPPASSSTVDSTSHVTVETVADLSSQTGPLSIVGTVKSVDQATILAQSAGEIVSLPHSIGDHVAAGEIIGQFENSSQRAAVTQAEGQYESAQVALAKAQGTTAANSGITSSQAQSTAQNSAATLSAAMVSLYTALDDSVHTKADTLFSNPRSITPTLLGFTVPDSQLIITINNERIGLEQTLSSAHDSSLNASDLDASAQSMLSSSKTVQTFLNNLILALNEAVPNSNFSSATIAADQTMLAAARTEVNSAVSSLTAAKSSYDAAVSSAQSAANTASTGVQSDIAAAQAALKTAQGTLDAAKANLEKTIIRSPISGVIVSLPVTKGDYVSSFAQVAVVSNPGALYVDAQVTQDDAKTLSVGSHALINGSTAGVITFIAPELDPTTGKIEVKVGINGGASAFSNSQAVTLSLSRAQAAPSKAAAAVQIPINAAKILPTGPVVFTVTASSTLEAHPISLGTILGDQVVVTSGLTPDLPIVTDARGLSAGQTVIIDSGAATSSAASGAR